VAGAFAVVNAVSLYVERGSDTFRSVHVEAAARVARYSRGSGVQRLAHVSGIGADAQSHSSYIRSRGEGESAVRAAFSEATIIRSSAMFGPDDAFLVPLMKMLRMFPVFPMFGRGQTALQPSYVEDVGEAIARCFDAPDPGMTYELAGPNTYTYKELLQTMCNYLDIWRVLAPMPISVWKMLAFATEFLPASPVTSNQVELMTKDNIASGGYPGFRALDIEPRGIEIVLAPARRVESA
jgi:NADH dehydrogenase